MKPLTKSDQARLDECVMEMAEIEEQLMEIENTIPANEQHLVHCRLTKGARYDQKTGKEIAQPYTQKFSVAAFTNFNKNAAFLGYSVEIIYDPRRK